MSFLKWILALIVSSVLFACGNLLIQLGLDYMFTNLNYWLSAVVGVVLCIIFVNYISAYAFFMLPYGVLRLRTMSYFYFILFSLVAALLMQAYRDDYHLDNSIPKWIQVFIAFLYFILTYNLKRNAEHMVDFNRKDNLN